MMSEIFIGTSSVTGKRVYLPKVLIGGVMDITNIHQELAQTEIITLLGYTIKVVEPASKVAEEIWGL